jgi:predicted ATPase/Flp pilus assembly protein TadD
LDTLFEFLQEKECLLILDNCEHLIQAAAQFVQSALQACRKLNILASSREILDVPGERPFHVPPLSMPKDQQMPTLEQWSQYEAMRLFVARAVTIFSEYQVTATNLASVVQICQRLDGIPLALELAAARVKMLTTAQIASGLDQRFQLLTTGNRSTLPRHQTLQALVDWSWELLPPDEQALLRRLSVFAGGMTLVAVTAVCTDAHMNEYEILDLLTQLVNKSLLIAEREQGQETRYRLLETIRQYGQERLAKVNESKEFRQRHLDYFLQLGEQAEKELVGPNQVTWINRLERELDNVRVALNWAHETNVEDGLRLATALVYFCHMRGNVQEWELRISQLLAQAGNVPPTLRAKALGVQCEFNFDLGPNNWPQALELAEESLAIYRELGDQRGIAFILSLQALAQDNAVLAEPLLRQSLEIYKGLDGSLDLAYALRLASQNGRANGNYDFALAQLVESERLYRTAGHQAELAETLNSLGQTALRQGDFVSARTWLEESLTIQKPFGERGTRSVLYCLGELALAQKEYEQARHYFEKSYSLNRESGNVFSSFWSFVQLGYAFLRLGEIAQARMIFSESQRQFQEGNTPIGVVFALEGLASLATKEEQFPKAAQLFAWADATRPEIGDPRPPIEQANVDKDIAAIIEKMGEAAFVAAYAAGKGMTMEEAIALTTEVGGD